MKRPLTPPELKRIREDNVPIDTIVEERLWHMAQSTRRHRYKEAIDQTA
jgi:hypothetical protein